MEENVVKLPCKIGNIAWYIFRAGELSDIIEDKIATITLHQKVMVVNLGGSSRYVAFDYNGNVIENNGEVYFDKKEAEKRLKEFKGKING